MSILILLIIIVVLESAVIVALVLRGKGFVEKTVESLDYKMKWMEYDIDRIAKMLEKKG